MSIDLSLARISQLVAHLPAYTRPTVHIAGTNGKGSVAALLASILCAATPPLTVGRFNSPHLVAVHDCIAIDGAPVDADVYSAARALVEGADREHGTRLSAFEILTVTALCVFEERKVDVAVVEVGMGGRLDATNVIPTSAIVLSALAAVDLDHQAFLGSTVSAIALEKAGIARPGRPFVLGPQTHADVVDAVSEAVQKAGAELVHALPVRTRQWDEALDGPTPAPFSLSSSSHTFTPPPPQPVSLVLPSFPAPIPTQLPLHGAHQLANLAIAATAVHLLRTRPTPASAHLHLAERITTRAVVEGVRGVVWPGRLSFHTVALQHDEAKPDPAVSGSPPALRPRRMLGLSAWFGALRGLTRAFAAWTRWLVRLAFQAAIPLNRHLPPLPHPMPTPKEKRLVVLADGAHNPASAATLGAYVSHLLSLALSSPSSSSVSTSQPRRLRRRRITLTYVLALSHSPPKTPLQTLSPILPPVVPDTKNVNVDVDVNVAVLRFTPPAGMPWVRSVAPSVMRDVVRQLVPGARVWAPDSDEEDPAGGGQLREALAWAAERMGSAAGEDDEAEGLVVLAGSLYLVADFYRFLAQQ